MHNRYFIYVKTQSITYDIPDLDKAGVEHVVDAYNYGRGDFMLGGTKYWLENLFQIKIFEIDVEQYPISRINTLRRRGRILSEEFLHLEDLGSIGKDVTDDYIKGEYGRLAHGTLNGAESINPKKCFIVHGHDALFKSDVYRLLKEDMGLDPVILQDEPDRGRTIIEKFEDISRDAAFAVILLTPDDDCGISKRARQNVVFEMGYFMAKLGRNRTIVIKKGDTEIPSDVQGVLYTSEENWKYKLQKEVQAIIDDFRTLV